MTFQDAKTMRNELKHHLLFSSLRRVHVHRIETATTGEVELLIKVGVKTVASIRGPSEYLSLSVAVPRGQISVVLLAGTEILGRAVVKQKDLTEEELSLGAGIGTVVMSLSTCPLPQDPHDISMFDRTKMICS